jgi:hypothetical protein
MQLWQPYDTHAKYCIGIGLLSLMQGATYFFLGMALRGGFISTGVNTVKAALISALVMFIFMFVVLMVFEANTKFKSCCTKWMVMLLFLSAPTAAWFAAAVPTATIARKVFEIASGVLHCLLFLFGYCQSCKEQQMPDEVTEKFITGPMGQKFTAYSDDQDLEQAEEDDGFLKQLDIAHPSKLEKEKKDSVAIRDAVHGSARRSLVVAFLVWFGVFLCDVWEVTRLDEIATNISQVKLTWPGDSNTVWPHALVSVGQEAFVANKFQVFHIKLDGPGTSGTVSTVTCPVRGTILDISATCDEDGTCLPLVLVQGDADNAVAMVNCLTGQVMPLLQQEGEELPSRFALQAGSAISRTFGGPMLAVLGDAVVEYSWESQATGSWSPLWKKLQVDGRALRSLDYEGSRVYLVEDSSDGVGSVLRTRDLNSLAELGKWVMPQGLTRPHGVEGPFRLAAGSVAGPNTLHLLPYGPTPNLLRWSPPLSPKGRRV